VLPNLIKGGIKMGKSIYVQRLDKVQAEIWVNLLKPNGNIRRNNKTEKSQGTAYKRKCTD